MKWASYEETGRSISSYTEALKYADTDLFPNVRIVLQICATRSSTTASNERSFSALKRLKTYLRSTMLAERLNGLALMNVHQDIEIPTDIIIDNFAKLGPHRLAFL